MILKRPSEIDAMAEAAVINREALESMEKALAPGITTLELNAIAEEAIVSRGGRPAFKGYKRSGTPPFPGTLCTSVNDVIVHGVPDERPLEKGDILSVDIGTFYKGYAADMAKTYAIGEISEQATKLLDVTDRSLYAGIAQCQVGNRLGDISAAIQAVIEAEEFWVVREFVGHGIGVSFHEKPDLPNYGDAGRGAKLRPGLVLAIEPMVTERECGIRILADGWTAPTTDGSLAAHYEHTVAITNDGPRILTAVNQEPHKNLDPIVLHQELGYRKVAK